MFPTRIEANKTIIFGLRKLRDVEPKLVQQSGVFSTHLTCFKNIERTQRHMGKSIKCPEANME